FASALVLPATLSAQVIARLTVEKESQPRNNVPVSVSLDEITFQADSTLKFTEVTSSGNVPVDFQIEHSKHGRFIWWLLQGNTPAGKERVFELASGDGPKTGSPGIQTELRDGGLVIRSGDRPVLNYQYETVYPPEGIDTVFKRSGFIHPLWSPQGKVLTTIQPRDHYHHYGIWNPWTHTAFRGDTIDFWNLSAKQGTVRFAGFTEKESGPVYGGFRARQEHIAHPYAEDRTVALNEVWDVRAFDLKDGKWLWDFTTELNCATSDPVTLLEYRYAGFGFRATEQWTNKNSSVLTSEGNTRKNADGSNAKWRIMQGEVDGSNAGILFMAFPSNYNFPEPLRIWPENANGGRGDMFFNFAPTKDMDWKLEPGNTYVLRYRMLVFDGEITAEQAEQTWQAFAHPPKVSVNMR
ncbi:MAG TPA: PmoA family protein, partial [Anseongella sp.]